MNPYAVVIVVCLLAEFLVNLAADLLNLRALDPELPGEFADVYDRERYARSQEYTRECTRFGVLVSGVDLLLVLAFWGLGGFPWLDETTRALGWGAIPTGLAYVGALVLARGAVHLPFEGYSTFVIEERYGFNKTTPATFVADRIKGLVLGGVIGGALLAAVLAFFSSVGESAWLWCWATVSGVSLLLQGLAPTLLLPLFYKFAPLEEGALRERLLRYAERVRFPVAGIFVIDGSRRSTKANAFFTGFGAGRRIALFDTLIEAHEPDELEGVLAHEVGHAKRRHVAKSVAISIVNTGVVFFLLSIALTHEGLFAAFGVGQPSVHAGLIFFALLYTPVDMVLSMLLQAFSRKNEYEADAYAAETTGAPESLVSALKKLSAENLANLTPHPFYVFLNHSHPPVLRRIAALRAAA